MDVHFGPLADRFWYRRTLEEATGWYPGLDVWLSWRDGETLSCGMPFGAEAKDMPIKAGQDMDEYFVLWWLNVRTGAIVKRSGPPPFGDRFVDGGIDE